MADATYTMKRGDDLSIPMRLTDPNNNGNAVDITGWTIQSQVRYSRELLADLNVTITNAASGDFTISATPAVTELWPNRKIKCDVQFDRPVTGRISSKTFYIDVEEDITHD